MAKRGSGPGNLLSWKKYLRAFVSSYRALFQTFVKAKQAFVRSNLLWITFLEPCQIELLEFPGQNNLWIVNHDQDRADLEIVVHEQAISELPRIGKSLNLNGEEIGALEYLVASTRTMLLADDIELSDTLWRKYRSGFFWALFDIRAISPDDLAAAVMEFDVIPAMKTMHLTEMGGKDKESYVAAPARDFLTRLLKCPPGKTFWKNYENLIGEIFSYLFVPPLRGSKLQSRADDGSEIRDIIFPNTADSGFWAYIRSEYKGAYIVVECKNVTKSDKSDVLQLSDYLQPEQLGSFGIMVSRGISQSALDQRRKAYSKDPHKMIVLLEDKDIQEMIIKKSDKENPEDVLRELVDLYRIQYRF